MDFSQNMDFSGLIVDELTQIRISQFIVHLMFTGGFEITVESDFEHLGLLEEPVAWMERSEIRNGGSAQRCQKMRRQIR